MLIFVARIKLLLERNSMKMRRNVVAGAAVGLAILAASADAQGIAPSQIPPGDAATILEAKSDL